MPAPTMPASVSALAPPIADRLLTHDAEGRPALLGAREGATGRIVFPAPDEETGYEPVVLPNEGILWSYTVQRFRPKSPPYDGPEAFTPYSVGYVALGNVIIVEGRLENVAAEDLFIGMPMRVSFHPFITHKGTAELCYAFVPAGDDA